MIDANMLEQELINRIQPSLPIEVSIQPGLVPALLECWDLESEMQEAVEFACRRFLDEQQDDAIEILHSGWPESTSGELPSPQVELDLAAGMIQLGFVEGNKRVLSFPPILLEDLEV